MSERHEWIADRAYSLWELAGRPDGQDHDHWRQASDAWDAEHLGRASTGEISTARTDWDEESEE